MPQLGFALVGFLTYKTSALTWLWDNDLKPDLIDSITGKKEQEAQLQHVIDYYAHNPFLQDARADMILHMAHVSQVKRWGKGDVIMATGDPVDGVLFLKSGQVMIRCEPPFAFCRRPC